MKRTYKLISISGMSGIGIVVLLLIMNVSHVKLQNGFSRKFVSHPFLEHKTIDLKFNSWYIAGITPSTLYLGNVTAPFHFLKLTTALNNVFEEQIGFKLSDTSKFISIRLQVDSHSFYLTDGNMRKILIGDILEKRVSSIITDTSQFSYIAALNANTFLKRSIDFKKKENILVKTTFSPMHTVINDKVLKKQIDGLFCTDGQMLFHKGSSKLIYIYYYRNQFLYLDTNLNLVFKSNTIDTNTKAKITVSMIDGKTTTRTFSSPPLVVNKRSATNGRFLFVNSNLKAENEYQNLFDIAPVIDVYDLNSRGTYKFSFHLSTGSKKQFNDIIIIENKIYVMHGHHLSLFVLDPDLLK